MTKYYDDEMFYDRYEEEYPSDDSDVVLDDDPTDISIPEFISKLNSKYDF